jgi:hypothetical protein
MSEPSVRASLVRMILGRLDEVSPEDAAAAREALGRAALERIERTAGHDWIPLAHEVAIARAVHARRGDEGARWLGREVGRGAIHHGLLRPLVTATLGMLGLRPSALLEVAVAGWRIATRNAGGPAHVRRCDRHQLELELTELPEVLRDRGMLLRMGGSMEALFELAGLSTALEVVWEPGSPRAVLRLGWSRGR